MPDLSHFSRSSRMNSLTQNMRRISSARRAGQGPLPTLSLPDTMRNNIVATIGEFVGTYLFLFFSLAGAQIANTPQPADDAPPNPAALILVSLAFGVSLTANVWAFYRITGGLFNPVVTLALVLCGGLPIIRAICVVPAQLIGGIAAAAVVSALFPGANLVLVCFRSFFSGTYFTGGSLNPARSLGPAVVNHSFPGYFWIYWVGPILGSLLACAFYTLLRALRYQDCNPGQDSDGELEDKRSHSPPEENGHAA
ncbi:aquaporin-like protein [Sodiomyces alkalinus F11]|uniref:Aquaporin-like protein n=1 Tax=Sodiomyces alkalinus (strain CBS 110278 / VKM F-3762 / F11) TaxID=1314773 RepID=A0A3N2Q5Z3_SODAK|nr:aquaporin-like protein [Sodiomyces alkalinus F11]ROT42203.1 aquaporin-like protein [Sodiomyces alkalinus F11]